MPTATVNTSDSTPDFILTSFPGLEAYRHLLSIPFIIMYSFAIVGNIAIIYIIKLEETLHTPMYILLCILAVVDIGLCNTTTPKMLAILLNDARSISFQACFLQMFFIYFFSTLESSILAVMAYDRYIAICNPLRYSTILTTAAISKILLVLFLRCAILTGLIPIMASKLPYCSSTVVPQTYCDHMPVANLACTDITINSYYGLSVAFLIVGMDVIFISFTYIMIIRAVLKLASKQARIKAFSTCGSHVFIILYFYTSGLGSFLTYRFSKNAFNQLNIVSSVLYLILPPVLNPAVYGVRTKEIRDGFIKHLRRNNHWSRKR
ncbi:olfactory receptor 52E4-like [Erpetoichthys calabaricus]|uniref:olfactory receptor 52E4-like n=1 Tax=Erpetoichthys calabaricus TaxID=27687 RepID=UPI0010A03836|nr:olfactory receptor 52E4-like [Erpetoichthys calabaricus]